MDASDVFALAQQLGDRVDGHPEHVREVVPQLVALLDQPRDPAEVAAIIDALGRAWDEEANLQALLFADHSDPRVRFAVAAAVPGGTESDAAMVTVMEALIRLSRDEADDVRDWATFGMGTQLTLDTSEVREALWARTTDASPDVRDEALAGLAHRRDRRVLPLVREQLAGSGAGPLVFEAAECLASPELLSVLVEWVAANPDDGAILRAHRACDPAYQDARTARQAALLASLERLSNEQDRQIGAALSCDRSSTDVRLRVDGSPSGWDVDGLLERAGNDAERAARLVLLDLHRAESGS